MSEYWQKQKYCHEVAKNEKRGKYIAEDFRLSSWWFFSDGIKAAMKGYHEWNISKNSQNQANSISKQAVNIGDNFSLDMWSLQLL